MATNRLALRNRPTGAQRAKADENATSKYTRQNSTIATSGAVRAGKDIVAGIKQSVAGPRVALNEVTTVNVNRKPVSNKGKDGKENPEKETLKRARSSSLAAATAIQRVKQPPVAVSAPAAGARQQSRVASRVSSAIAAAVRPSVRLPSRAAKTITVHQDEAHDEEADESAVIIDERDLAETIAPTPESDDEAPQAEEDEADEEPEEPVARSGRKRAWPDMSTARAKRCKREVDHIRENFQDDVDMLDPTMVSEYAPDIFRYMEELEVDIMPDADYMSGQTEITWQMRETLVDWLLQVHMRYHMLPETLWIAINIVDRFLSKRIVSLVKLQLVGVTAMFIAAKYEEILAPSVDEFVFLTESGYTREEILKGESIVLTTLEFRVSQYCSPYSWMRKISKADDYEIQTRTLAKFLTELTLLDHRFLAVKPSLIAAVGMYSARRMLGGDWNEAFIFHSGFTEEEVQHGHRLLVDKLSEEGTEKTSVYKKYAHKKFLKASTFAVEWSRANYDTECTPLLREEDDEVEQQVMAPSEGMVVE